MSKANKNTMVRILVVIWEKAVARGLEIDRSATWVVTDWIRRGAKEDGVELPKKNSGE